MHHSRLGRGFRRILFPYWVRRKLKQYKPEVIHYGGIGGIGPINNWFGYTLINRWAEFNNAKTVTVHSLADNDSEAFSERGWHAFWRNQSFDKINKIVSVSPQLNQGVKTVFPNKTALITYGIRDDLFLPLSDERRQNVRQKHEVEDDEVVFSFLGTVDERKGFDLLLEGFSNLSQENEK